MGDPRIGGNLRMITHHFWPRKGQFALDKDIYDWWTVFAVEEGSFAYRIGDKSGEAAFGDLVVCPPKVWFHRRTIEPLTFHFFHFELDENRASAAEPPLPSGVMTIGDAVRLSSCYSYLKKFADQSGQEANQWKNHLLLDMIQLYFMENALPPHTPPASYIREDMLWAKEYIKSHSFEKISMGKIAENLAVTPVQFTRRFRAAFGMTPTEYATKLRIDRVCRLLEETRLTLDEIAQRVGYENGFYLSRVFSKHKAMNPSAYRKMRLV